MGKSHCEHRTGTGSTTEKRLTIPEMKNYTLFLLFFSTCLSLFAREPEKHPFWKVELAGSLNNYDAWEIEPSVTFLPIHYVGVGVGMLFTQPYQNESIGGTSTDKQFRWSNTTGHATSYFFALRPSLQFNSPKLWMGRDKDYALYLTLSPGLTLPLPANRQFSIDYFPNRPGTWTALRREQVTNEGARTVYYHLRTTLTLETDGGFLFSAGYTCSDFDLYGGSRHIVIEGQKLGLPKHKLMHSVSVSLGYRF